MNYSDKIEFLADLLPAICQLKDRTVVIKYGGAAMKNEELTTNVVKDVIFLASCGVNVVIVHGGGPLINQWLNKINIEPKFCDGVRITDHETMEVVEMVLAGKINKTLVSLINSFSGKAIGLSGKDGNMLIADPTDLSFKNMVGRIKHVNSAILDILLENKFIPIIAPIASDASARSYNINADTVAGEIASSLLADKLIILTDTSGILTDFEDTSTLIPSLNVSKVQELINQGIISGGMLPKVDCCVKALKGGVSSACIIDGRVQHSLLLTLLGEEQVGSTIVL